MKFVVWGATLLLAMLWTLAIALCASIANWLAGSADQWVGGLQVAAQWPLPAWAALWVDPAWVEPLKSMLVSSLDVVAAAAPWIVPMLEWLAPLLWVVWAIGMVVLLAASAVGSVLLGRLRNQRQVL